MKSIDFAGVEELQRTGRWDEAGKLLAAEAQALVAAGASGVPLMVEKRADEGSVADRRSWR